MVEKEERKIRSKQRVDVSNRVEIKKKIKKKREALLHRDTKCC